MSNQTYDFFGLIKKTLLVVGLMAIIFVIALFQSSYISPESQYTIPELSKLPSAHQPASNSTPSPQPATNSTPSPQPLNNSTTPEPEASPNPGYNTTGNYTGPEPVYSPEPYYEPEPIPEPVSEPQGLSPAPNPEPIHEPVSEPQKEKNPACINVANNPECDLKCTFNKNNKQSIKCKITTHCTIEVKSARIWVDLDGYLGPLEIKSEVISDDLFVDITYNGDEYKLNTMAKYKVEITSKENNIYSTEISRGCRIALLFAGRLGRVIAGGGNDEGMVVNETAPSHKRHFIYPNLDAGCEIDIFAHTWARGFDNHFLGNYAPWIKGFKSEDYPGRGKMIVSMERAIQMRKEYEDKQKVAYDWIVFYRYDVYLFSNYTMTHLNLDLVYISNWCKASSPERLANPTPNHYKCSPVNAGAFWPEQRTAVPDFFFAGTPENTDKTFIGMWDDTEARRYYWDAGVPELHNYFGGRLFSLHDQGKIKLGRYRYHEMDYDLLRYITGIPGRGVYIPEYLFYWSKPETTVPDNNCPYLKQNYPYWDTTINHQYDPREVRKLSYCGPDRTRLWYYCLKPEFEPNMPRAFLEI